MDLKSLLKALKLNESTISMFLGALIILAASVFAINYFRRGDRGMTLPTGDVTENTDVEKGPTIIKDGKKVHIVQPNDNLWKISEKYYESGYNWVDITKENNLKNPNLISKGQELVIPEVQSKKATVLTKIADGDGKGTTAILESSYTVTKGDTLWNIAVRTYGDGYQWVKIARENNLSNPSLIHSGNILRLPER